MGMFVTSMLLFGDFAFTYSLSSMKVLLNTTYAYEFALRFADAAPFSVVPLVYAALLTLIFAWLTDCFFSKYYIILTGLLCEFISCLALCSMFFGQKKTIAEGLAILSIAFLALYISTSPFRNIMHLEWGPRKESHIRLYIFLFIYSKVLARGLPRIFIVLHSQSIDSSSVNGVIVLTSAVIYLLLVSILRGRLKLEPLYFNIWKEVYTCVTFGLAPKPLVIQKPYHLHKKKAPNTAKTPHTVKTPHTAKTKALYKLPTPIIEEHWLSHASPYFSAVLLQQTVKFFNVLFFIFPGIFFGISIFYISSVTLMQAEITSKLHTQLITDSDLLAFPDVVDMVLFPVFEFLLFPFLRKVLNRDLHYLILGYVLLIAATISLFIIQSMLEVNLKYLPEPRKAYIRIYNDFPMAISIHSFWTGTVEVLPFDVYSQRIPVRNIAVDLNRSLEIAIVGVIETDEYAVEFIEKQCVSYIYSKEGMIRQGISDPTLYVFNRNDKKSFYYLVSYNNSEFQQLTFTPITSNGSAQSVVQQINSNKANTIDPGNYAVTLYSIKETVPQNNTLPLPWSIISSIVKTNYTIKFTRGTMNALAVFRNTTGFIVQTFVVQGPVPVDIVHTFMALSFTSIGHAVAAVSYFKFLYLEGPEKLRGSVFSLLLIFSLLGVTFLKAKILPDQFTYSHSLLLMILIQCCTLMAIVVFEHFFEYHYYA